MQNWNKCKMQKQNAQTECKKQVYLKCKNTKCLSPTLNSYIVLNVTNKLNERNTITKWEQKETKEKQEIEGATLPWLMSGVGVAVVSFWNEKELEELGKCISHLEKTYAYQHENTSYNQRKHLQ